MKVGQRFSLWGWPSVAVGTFGGKVNRIFPTDDGKGNFRVLVSPHKTTKSDSDWPDDRYLRQGVRANGWVLLKEVPLGYEIWRQLNGFPPTVDDQPDKEQGKSKTTERLSVPVFFFSSSLRRHLRSSHQCYRRSPSNEPGSQRSRAYQATALQATMTIRRVQESFPSGLSIADVIASLYQCYPEIQQAREEYRRTSGELLSTWGAFDTKLKGYSLNEPTGFYENNRHAIGLARQTWWGGYLSAGYRVGRGDFQPWYKERETDKSGEFKLGWTQPLLRGKAIDFNRVAVFRASLARQAAQPTLQQAILDAAREATETYWQWVTAGTVLKAQQELLTLAETRGQQFEAGLEAGKFAEIDVVLNRQLIAERTVKVLDAQRKFQAAAFKLSLFLRDDECKPIVASESWLPDRFPITERPTGADLQSDLAAALARRPEPRVIQFDIDRSRWEQQLACNDTLPSLDFVAEASQDIGTFRQVPADDKDESLLIVGVQGEVPIQRRKARGKVQSTSAKIAQLRQKLNLQQNKIEAELRIAYNALSN